MRPGLFAQHAPTSVEGCPPTDRDDPAYRGQSECGRLLLSLDDPLVLGPIAGTYGDVRRRGSPGSTTRLLGGVLGTTLSELLKEGMAV